MTNQARRDAAQTLDSKKEIGPLCKVYQEECHQPQQLGQHHHTSIIIVFQQNI